MLYKERYWPARNNVREPRNVSVSKMLSPASEVFIAYLNILIGIFAWDK